MFPGMILLLVMILLLLGEIPAWGHSRDWDYGPGGGLGLIRIMAVVLAFIGRI